MLQQDTQYRKKELVDLMLSDQLVTRTTQLEPQMRAFDSLKSSGIQVHYWTKFNNMIQRHESAASMMEELPDPIEDGLIHIDVKYRGNENWLITSNQPGKVWKIPTDRLSDFLIDIRSIYENDGYKVEIDGDYDFEGFQMNYMQQQGQTAALDYLENLEV